MKDCPQCGGTGQVPDDVAVGLRAREARLAANRSMREVAAEMGYSSAYLHDLEYGRRRWTPKALAATLRVLRVDVADK